MNILFVVNLFRRSLEFGRAILTLMWFMSRIDMLRSDMFYESMPFVINGITTFISTFEFTKISHVMDILLVVFQAYGVGIGFATFITNKGTI